MHSHHHVHAHPHGSHHENKSLMVVALAINVALLAIGVAGWIAFDSVALLADAGHVLSDVGAIALGVFAATVAARPPTAKRTFGYARTEILAALANGVLLVAVAVLVFVEAIGRLNGSPDVGGGGVLAVGLIGLAGNAVATAVLQRGDREDINLEGVLRHSAADALGSLGVIVAGAVVLATGWDQADAVAGMLIGVLVLLGSWRLISEPVNVLMEGAPPGVNANEVGEAMARVEGVREVHDLHVWTVTSGFPALAAHVIVEPAHDPDEVRRRVEAVLKERFGIEHTTLQAMAERLLELEDRLPGNR
ncbi:MAG TPA: cation diffusion facilitator family transporter [Thermoleophilaceae bacterium]